MSATRASVARLALMKIGATDAYETPNGNPASRAIDAAWDLVRRACLRGHGKHQPKWNFALAYAELLPRAVTLDAPLPFRWGAAYTLPIGSVRLVEIADPPLSTGQWQVAGGEVLTYSTGLLSIWCLADIDDPARWDASFTQAFAARLAFEIADVVSADPARRRDCWQEFEAALSAASKVDAVENPPIEAYEDDWLTARIL